MQTSRHLAQLIDRLAGRNHQAVGEGVVGDDLGSSRQDDPPLAGALIEWLIAHENVVAMASQQLTERGEMAVDHEPRHPQRPGTKPGLGGDVEPLEHRVHPDPGAGANPMLVPHGLAVDDDQLDFRQGHTASFDQAPHLGVDLDDTLDLPVPGKMVVQFGIEPQRHRLRHYDHATTSD